MQNQPNYRARLLIVIAILLLVIVALLARLLDLSIFQRHFLLKQSDARAMRVISTPAYRGMITDRYGIPLAISTPMDSIWINPALFSATPAQLQQLAKLLQMRKSDISQRLQQNSTRQFLYLKREVPPEVAAQIKVMALPGLFFQREYRRYYPEGEVMAHVVGFTNIDDVGQDGLELAYDRWLRGVPGKERVLKDRLGNIIAIMDVLSQPVQGRDLNLSIDARIQYLAYQNLSDAVAASHADAGSVVVLDPKTGEILAMANVPSYNPNGRPLIPDDRFRNRAVTDLYEPGSTMKTFSVVTALLSGKFTPNSLVDTNPGALTIDGHTIHDDVPNNGVLTLSGVLQRSSNIGIAKVILTLTPQQLLDVLQRFGFGQVPHSGFPGESPGVLSHRARWSKIDIATVSFGYGVSVTALQLAHAYAAIANGGVMMPLTYLKRQQQPLGQQIIPLNIAQQVLAMLESVVTQTGASGRTAAIPGYRVGGKTGTSYTAKGGGYDKTHYNASFVGIAPVSDPRLVVVVVLHGVHGQLHFGAQVAAPVFQNVTSAALRIMNVPADNYTPQATTPTAPAKTNLPALPVMKKTEKN